MLTNSDGLKCSMWDAQGGAKAIRIQNVTLQFYRTCRKFRAIFEFFNFKQNGTRVIVFMSHLI